MSIASNRPKRWFAPPPQRTAYFSSARCRGVVFRVSWMLVRPPPAPAMASTNCRVRVAMPLRCVRKFSATRSPARIARVLPSMRSTADPARTVAPSFGTVSSRMYVSRARKTRIATGSPARTKSCLAMMCARAVASAATVASDVTSPGRAVRPKPKSSSSAARISPVISCASQFMVSTASGLAYRKKQPLRSLAASSYARLRSG